VIVNMRERQEDFMHTDIEAAAERIADCVRITPVIHLEKHIWGIPGQLALKLELFQHAGSFKSRGAFNRVLSNTVPPDGLIAASGGNHGIAVAYVGQKLGLQTKIFVPRACSPVKIERLRSYGARVTIEGATYAEALAASQAYAEHTDALVVHAYDQQEVIIGQGTLAREFEQQVPGLDTVLIAIGGGGLIAGAALWFAGRVRLIGVEPVTAPSMAEALSVGEPVDTRVGGIAVDSLGARRVGHLAFSLVQQHVARVVLVSDEAIRLSQRTLWHDLRVLAEPGGATALAALLSGAYRPEPGERVGVVICGGNADPATLA
jgi:threonine dehydratase